MKMAIARPLLAALLGLSHSAFAAVTSPAIDPHEEAQTTSGVPQSPAAAEPVPKGNPLWGIPLRQLRATRERPLFTPSRRPPPPVVANTYQMPSAPPPPPEPEKPQLSLVGTVTGSADAIGVFVEQAAKNVLRLKTGEAYNGWMLQMVRPREAVFARGQESVVLAMPTPDSKGAARPASLGLAPAPTDAAPAPASTGLAPAPADAASTRTPVATTPTTPSASSADGRPSEAPAGFNPFPLPPGIRPSKEPTTFDPFKTTERAP
jgi:general secretion pathway protein N